MKDDNDDNDDIFAVDSAIETLNKNYKIEKWSYPRLVEQAGDNFPQCLIESFMRSNPKTKIIGIACPCPKCSFTC